MKAKMKIVGLLLTGIKAYGGPNKSPVGHNFCLEATLDVDVRTRGVFSGEGIDCPQLEWKENIEWFEYKLGAWSFKGRNQKDMYAANPLSNTFAAWGQVRYLNGWYPPNRAPVGVVRPNTDKDAKHWIAKNGLKWKIKITDVPGMGLKAGSGGGGGASLLTGDTRRRVIYFDLGFSGQPAHERVKCVQVLETQGGQLAIHKFIKRATSKDVVNNETNLSRWRSQVNSADQFTV